MSGRPHTPIAVPLYRQVTEILTGRIARGDWAPGEQLPSEPRLAQELGVSPGTVRKALDEMTADQLLVRRQGAGTYVATATADNSLFRFFRLINADGERVMPSAREEDREIAAADEEEAARLDLPVGDPVLRIRRIRLSQSIPIMMETVILPVDRMPGLRDWEGDFPNTLYDFYQERVQVTIRDVEEVLRAVAADSEQAHLFQVPKGAPLLEIKRRATTFDAVPVELRDTILDSTNFAYLSELS